ncbi:MAG: DUF72 domain-containing protein [Pseudomonadota bacterium]|nr:DUF72 domain-containing protein [Pseudomonadota bacterium]
MIVATAGWSIPRDCAAALPGAGTHLQRYAARLAGVEINTSFYRDHSRDTYARWAAQVPAGFRFSLKLPRQITHDQRLRAVRRPLEAFLQATSVLGRRRGPLVVQLPPSLPFEPRVARRFFALLRECHAGHVVCEPRHPAWFTPAAEALLTQLRIARVAADPAVVPAAAQPGGWPGIVYCRLHGSPRKYWSAYGPHDLEHWAGVLAAPRRTPVWCVFDNTASGAAMANALQMLGRFSPPAPGSSTGSRRGSAGKPAAARHK